MPLRLNAYTFPLPDHDEKYCTRAKLDTGTFCNYDCTFCYYKDSLHIVTDFDTIRRRIDYIVECGIDEVDLSGGESSVHKEWFKILDYCKSKGLKISTISNGYKFANEEFVTKSKEHGLQEIMFSIHGHNAEIHDRVVGRRGAFDRLIKGYYNCKNAGLRVRLNYVITGASCKDEQEYIDLFNEMDPFELNFLTLNFFNQADQYLNYNTSTNHCKQLIDNLNIKIMNVRYTPYCYMKGYEKYVCNTFQHIHDIYDWNMAVYDQRIDAGVYKIDPYKALYMKAQEDRLNMYKKPDKCVDCKYLFICDGLENQVNDEVYPEPGTKIRDINHYRRGYYEI
jgi:MoaA/NifB/PqqE/SkfB family radical SAM enzyme